MKKGISKKVQGVIDEYTASKTDVLGSYTGLPTQSEQPEQDADDL